MFLTLCGGAPAGAQVRSPISPLFEGPERTRPELPPPVDERTERDPLGRLLPKLDIPPGDTEASALAGGEINVRGFRFTGNSAFSDEELEVVTRPYVGEGRRYGALLEARDRITRAYIDAGFISSGAVLPKQTLADGIVDIQIVEGHISELDVQESGRLRERYVSSRLIGSDTALNINELRNRLNSLKRDPRIDGVTAKLMPGSSPGESQLTVVVAEARPWWVSAQADNATPPSIGSYGGSFQAGHRNLTGWGDALTLGYRVTEGLNDAEVRYLIPLTRWETMLELSGRRAWADVIEPSLSTLDLQSETSVLEFRLHQPILRANTYEVRVFVGADRKTGRATLGGDSSLLAGLVRDFGTTRSAAVRVGGESWWRGRQRALAGRATVSFGLDALGASNGTSFKDPKQDFVSALFQVQGVEYLPWYRMRLHARIDFQLANQTLLGLEQLALGGEGSVRGFRKNVLVRDEGVAASLELRVPLPTFGPIERLELGTFSDYAYGRNLGDNPLNLARSERLWALGLGLHVDVTPYVSASAQWAGAILEPPKGSGADTQNDLQDKGFHFEVRVSFP